MASALEPSNPERAHHEGTRRKNKGHEGKQRDTKKREKTHGDQDPAVIREAWDHSLKILNPLFPFYDSCSPSCSFLALPS
jgi:hypothetical protein